MGYKLSATKRFKKAYKKKPAERQVQVDKTLRLLQNDPRYPGLNTHRVKGTDEIWECYINDAFRITFQYSGEGNERRIVLRNNCQHDKVLRPPY